MCLCRTFKNKVHPIACTQSQRWLPCIYKYICKERERERYITGLYWIIICLPTDGTNTHTHNSSVREREVRIGRGPYCTVCCVWNNWDNLEIKGLCRWPWQKRGGEYKSGSAAPAVHSMVIILIIFSTRERERENRKKKKEKKSKTKKSGATWERERDGSSRVRTNYHGPLISPGPLKKKRRAKMMIV